MASVTRRTIRSSTFGQTPREGREIGRKPVSVTFEPSLGKALHQAESLLRKHGCDLEITLNLLDETSPPPSNWFNKKRMRRWCLAGSQPFNLECARSRRPWMAVQSPHGGGRPDLASAATTNARAAFLFFLGALPSRFWTPREPSSAKRRIHRPIRGAAWPAQSCGWSPRGTACADRRGN